MLEVQVQLLESALKSSIIPIPPIEADKQDDIVFIQQPAVLINQSESNKIRGTKVFKVNGKENSDLMQIAARELALI